MAGLRDTMYKLHDPRVKGRCSHPLADIIVLAVLAVICGAESYDSIEEFGKIHYEKLKERLRFPNGIPSHDTINRVFQSINFRHFERLFAEWASQFKSSNEERVIAVDGKTVCGSKDGAKGKSPVHLVHAWSVDNGICLGQYKTECKSNEITAIPELLDMLVLDGAIVTIDAMGTQKAIAQKIRDNGADYILALKGNQGTLRQDAELVAKNSRPVSESETVDKGHGRVETRRCQVYLPDEYICENHEWPDFKTIVKITATRFNSLEGSESTEVRYYISSLDQGQPFGEYIRGHWAVENSLHWVLDMSFGEDYHRKRAGNSAQNFALARKLALNILKKDKGKGSLVTKRLKAGWDMNYLLSLLKI